MIGFTLYLLFAFCGPSPKFRFSSGVIAGFSGAVLLPYFLFPYSLIVSLFRFSWMRRFRFLNFRLLGFFVFGLRNRASASHDKAGKKCNG